MLRSDGQQAENQHTVRTLAFIAGSLALVPLTFGGISYLLSHEIPGVPILVFGVGVLLPFHAARRDRGFAKSWLLSTGVAGGYVLYGIEVGGTGREFSVASLPMLVLGAAGIGVVLAAIGHVLGWYSNDVQRSLASRTSSRD